MKQTHKAKVLQSSGTPITDGHETTPRCGAKEPPKRYYRKRVELFKLIDKIKLWPSRKGILHGIKSIERIGLQARLTTHCGKTFIVNNSRNSRAARWLRNKWFGKICSECKVPDWKLEKYSATGFKRHYGSLLTPEETKE